MIPRLETCKTMEAYMALSWYNSSPNKRTNRKRPSMSRRTALKITESIERITKLVRIFERRIWYGEDLQGRINNSNFRYFAGWWRGEEPVR